MAAQRTGAVSVATLSGLIIALVVTDVLAPRWVQSLGLDVWNYRELREDARSNQERGVDVEAERLRLQREVELCGHTVHRYTESRVTLEEAIDELTPLLRHRVGFECSWPQNPPPSFRHGVARYIITRAEVQLEDNPSQWAVVSAKYKAEYAALK